MIARMNVGGPAWQVALVQRSLGPPEFESVLAYGKCAGDELDFLELYRPPLQSQRIAELGRSVRFMGEVRALLALVGLIRRFRPHIVETHTAKAGALGRVAALIGRVPIRVHVFHGHLLHGYFGPSTTKIVTLVERVLARYSTAIVTIGSKVRDDLLAAGIGRPEQYSVIPPGSTMPSVVDRSEARRLLGLESSDEVVSFVGRLAPIKRPDRLLAAFRLVLARRPSARLLVVGDGELMASSQELARDLGSRVIFLGWRSDVSSIFTASDVVVLTSDNEGMPVSLIEAAMVGRACVTTDVGSAAEVVLDGETGFVVATTADSVAGAIVRLLADPDLRVTMETEAHATAIHRFGEARLVSDYRSLYTRLVALSG